MALTPNQQKLLDNQKKRQEMAQAGVIPANESQLQSQVVQNPPVVPPQQTTPPQTVTGVNGEQFQVAPVNPQTGLSQPEPVTPDTTKPIIPVQEIAKSPTEQQINQAREVARSVTPTTPVKTEAPIDYAQAKGREQDIIKNLDTFKAQGMTPEQIMKASDYANASPEKKAIIEPYLKQTQPSASSMFNALVSKADISDEQKTGTGYKIAQNRYLKANMYASMTPSQVSQAMTDSKLIEGSQTWEDLKTLNPKLAQDVQNLRIINGSKPNIFKYVNNPDGTPVKDENGQPVKENQLTKQFTQDYLDDYGDFLRRIYTVQTPEQISAAIYTPDVKAAEDKANEIELELNAIEKDINSVDKDVDTELEGTGATGSRIRLEKASRTEKLQNLYNSTLKNYTTYANKANNLITQNTAIYKSQQEQQQNLQNALAGAAKSKFETNLAMESSLALSKAQFDQKLEQNAMLASDPTTAIGNILNQFSELGIIPDRDVAWHVAEQKRLGMTLPEYTQKIIADFKAKPQYQAMSAYKMSQYTPKTDTTPFQLANLGDGRAIMYNQSTGEYQQINASAVNTAAQSPATIAQYSQQTRGKTNLQCGELVNDYWTQFTGGRAGMGDTYQSKIDAIKKIGSSNTPQVGGVFVLDTGTSTGHTGIVTGVNGNQITVLEANRAGKKEGEPPVEATYTISDKFTFSNPPAKEYSDSEIELLSELANMDSSARNTALKAQGIPLSAVTDYMAKAKSGKIPPTESQKQSATQILSNIQDIATIDWNDATGVHFGVPSIAGTDRATAESKINNLVASITLPNLGMLKGPMSDKDLAFIQNASSKLAISQSDAEFEKQLVELYNISARKAGIAEIKKLSDIPKERILPGQPQNTNTGAGQISPQDLAELQKLFNQ